MKFSNHDLVEAQTRLFASTAAVQSPIAGRQAERSALRAAVLDPDIQVYRLWAPVGAGKTFLLNNVWGNLNAGNDIDFDEARDVRRHVATGLSLSTKQTFTDAFPSREDRVRSILVIEEFDRKTSFDKLVGVAERARDWLATTDMPSPLLLLTGDAFLTHPIFDELFGSFEGELATVDALTLALLKRALALRIDRLKGVVDEEPSDASLEDAAAIVHDTRVGAGLVPPTRPDVATFRDALSTLRLLANAFPPDADGISVPGSLLRRLRIDRPATGLPGELLSALISVMATQEPLNAMQESELATLAQTVDSALIGEEEEYADAHGYYWEEAIMPLVMGGYLNAVGVPYLTDSSAIDPRVAGPAVCGPYIPSPKAYRLAYA